MIWRAHRLQTSPQHPDVMEKAAMSISQDPFTQRLVRQSDEYRQLLEKHRDFDDLLSRLTAKNFLSEQEKLEAITLKKQKLALKDRMAEIARGFAEPSAGGARR